MTVSPKIESIIADFVKAADLADMPIPSVEIEAKKLSPHLPPTKLPPGMLAVYIFMHGDARLKGGRAGPNSSARYCYQHYVPGSARSTLAGSLLRCGKPRDDRILTLDTVRDWICGRTQRTNILIPKEYGIPTWFFLRHSFNAASTLNSRGS